MKENAQNKDLNIKARCYDVDFKEEPNEYLKIEEIIHKVAKIWTLHTLC